MHEWKQDEHCIFHVDVNSAFLSWSALKKLEEDPKAVDLRTIPSAVGGDVQTRHGIITAKSIPAKKYGVQTGEPVVKALQKCPSLVLVKSDFAVYRRYSHALMDILREYTDFVEQASIDEAYLDMTQSRGRLKGSESADLPWPLNAAHEIRKRVYRELGFTVNVGISVNKLLAKMASDFEKPDKVHTLFPEEVPSKLWPLPMRELHGCGKATAQRLHEMGIETIGQAAAMSLPLLQANLGEKAGLYIWKSANGRGSVNVKTQREKAKSYSNEETTAEDITNENYRTLGLEIIGRLSRKVASRMEKAGVYAQTVGVNVKTEDFRRHSRQVTLTSPTRDAEVIRRESEKLMEDMVFGDEGFFAAGHGLRLIGIGCTNLSDGSYMQMDLFSWAQTLQERKKEEKQQEELRRKEEEKKQAELRRKEKEQKEAEQALRKKEKLEAMMTRVQTRYGKGAISKGAPAKTPSHFDQ